MCVFYGWTDVAKQTLSISDMGPFIYKANSIKLILSRGSIWVWPKFSEPETTNHYIANIIKSPVLAITVQATDNFIRCGYLSQSELLWRNQNSQQLIIANIFDSFFYFSFTNDNDDYCLVIWRTVFLWVSLQRVIISHQIAVHARTTKQLPSIMSF